MSLQNIKHNESVKEEKKTTKELTRQQEHN